MKPSQKIIVACRQTADSARRLCDWLDANPLILGAAHAAVIEDIEGMASGLAPIAIAAETPPVIGVIGSQGAGKSDLVLQLLGPRGPSQQGELGTKPADIQMLRNILESDQGGGGCLAVRLTSSELPPAPRGYPIRFALLSEVEVATILAQSRLATPGPSPVALTPAEADRLFAEAADQVSLQPVPGVASRDILDLRETLTTHWAGHPFLGALAAIRYFERLRDVAAHLKDTDRRQLLSVLWGREEATTAVFLRLCAALDDLGHGGEAFATPEALIGKDRVTGWLVRHPRSIADASTLLSLTRTRANTIGLMSRYGKTVEIDRGILSALAAELALQAGPGRLTDMAPADLVDFPTSPMIAGSAAGTPLLDGPSSASLSDLAFAVAVESFAKSKPPYLFQRATRRRDVTSLVLAVDTAIEDDAAAPLLSEWIETAQGASETARERVRRGLFVAAAAPLRQPNHSGDGQDTPASRVMATVRDLLETGQSWAANWSPGRAVDQVYWFARSGDHMQTSYGSGNSQLSLAAAAAMPGSQTTIAPSIRSGLRSGGFVLATRTPTTSLASTESNSLDARVGDLQRTSEYGIGELAAELARVATTRAKVIQLSRGVAEVRRRLRNAVARHHVSNDPAAIAEWRRSMAVVACNRLAGLAERRLLGRLLRVLLPSEREFLDAILAAGARPTAHEPFGFSRSELAVPPGNVALFEGIANEPPPQADSARLAIAALAYWFSHLKRTARSRTTCRDLRIEASVLHHITDELQSGAIRIGL
ncbi:MAG: putative virulence factor, partial [Hyphomicrobiaceae bacterium]|nr:putative virulence factor [Hyphomicrobiaceae bacterium]